MTPNIRALVAALAIIVVAGALMWYAGSVRRFQATHGGGITVATTGDVNDLFGSPSDTGSRVILALHKLENSYYKPIDPQTPLDGEASALTSFLKSKKIASPALPHESATGDAAADATKLVDVLDYAEGHYASKLGADGKAELSETALRGIMNSVKDPYTVYLSQREIQGLSEQLAGGNFGGIGVYIEQLKTGEVVVMPIEGMPAALKGMKPGDVVDSVDGTPVRGMVLDRVEQLIRGDAGTTVVITTHPYPLPHRHVKPAERSYAIVRQIIHVPSVKAKMEGNIDYIRLSDFGSTSADEIRTALLDGKSKGAKGYILDLRDNGGGLLEAAVKISSFWIPQGTIVSTIARDGSTTTEEADGQAIAGLQPLVILVNGYTASSSEITSGALQDYHLATLIGTKTFGKGVVQSIYMMPDAGGALKITTARYVTPLGRDIQHKGITPDIVINQDPDPTLIDTPADKQLAAAKARLRKLIR